MNVMTDPEKSLSLIVAGLALLYFAWLYSATGIFVVNRSHVAVTASEDPERFSIGVATTVIVGLGSLAGGLFTTLRR